MQSPGLSISLKEAAASLGVHYMTVYRYIRLGMLPARKVGANWRIAVADLRLLDTAPGIPARRRSAPWRDRLEARMLAGDGGGSWKVAEAAVLSGMEPSDFYCDVLVRVLHSIGGRWESGQIGIEDEHLASGIASGIIGRLGPRFVHRGRGRGTVVTAMPTGEGHFLGLAMLADILRSEGYQVLNLGPDTPSHAVLSTVARVDDVAAVAVAVVATNHLGGASSLIRTIRPSAPGIPLLAGGNAIPDEDTARDLGADGWASDARKVGALISRLTRGHENTEDAQTPSGQQ